MDTSIQSANQYADNGGTPGSYSFDAATQIITFTSGSLKGNFSRLLPGNRIGLSTKSHSFYATDCQLSK